MEIVVWIVVIAALAGAVFWNHRNKAAAMDGAEFSVAEPPEAVVQAITALYCHGATASMKALVSKVSVSPSGRSGFRFATRHGDVGRIVVESAGTGSVVRANTSELYVGGHPSVRFRNGLMAISSAIMHRLFVLLGIAPFAVNMKRFQRRLERRVVRKLRAQVVS